MNGVLMRAFGVWLVQLVVIVVLGGLRDTYLQPLIGDHRAHQVGTIAASLAVFGIICLLISWIGPASRVQAFGLGVFWLLLALVFEFGVFHFIVGVPWPRLLAGYNLAQGNLLVVLWLTVLLAPVVCFALRDRGALPGGVGRG